MFDWTSRNVKCCLVVLIFDQVRGGWWKWDFDQAKSFLSWIAQSHFWGINFIVVWQCHDMKGVWSWLRLGVHASKGAPCSSKLCMIVVSPIGLRSSSERCVAIHVRCLQSWGLHLINYYYGCYLLNILIWFTSRSAVTCAHRHIIGIADWRWSIIKDRIV